METSRFPDWTYSISRDQTGTRTFTRAYFENPGACRVLAVPPRHVPGLVAIRRHSKVGRFGGPGTGYSVHPMELLAAKTAPSCTRGDTVIVTATEVFFICRRFRSVTI